MCLLYNMNYKVACVYHVHDPGSELQKGRGLEKKRGDINIEEMQ